MGLDAPEKYQEGDDFEFWLDSFGLDICAMGASGTEQKGHYFLTYWEKKFSKK